MTLDVVNAQNEKVDSVEISDAVFGGRVDAGLVWESVVHQNASERRGYPLHEDSWRGTRHGEQAVAAKGYGASSGR